MKRCIYFYNLCWLILSVLIFLINFIIQKFILNNFVLDESLKLFKSFNLVYVQNFGAAFGFLSEQNGWQKWFFIFFGFFVSFFLIVLMCLENFDRKIIFIAYSCVIGGTLGNVIDRLIYGFVIDFIDIYIGFLHWPTFNINDVGIFIGMFFLFLDDYIYN